jgi:biotin synthase-like enzyme
MQTYPNLKFIKNLKIYSRVATSGLEVFAHNIETVERLTPFVRDPKAKYRQTLKVLEHAKKVKKGLVTKSSIMLGLGESGVRPFKTGFKLCANSFYIHSPISTLLYNKNIFKQLDQSPLFVC